MAYQSMFPNLAVNPKYIVFFSIFIIFQMYGTVFAGTFVFLYSCRFVAYRMIYFMGKASGVRGPGLSFPIALVGFIYIYIY
jgi:hypothetical protein